MKTSRSLLIGLATLLCAPAAAASPVVTKSRSGSVRPKAKRRIQKANANKMGRKKVKARFKIGVQFVRTADNDGGAASTLTRSDAQAAIDRANKIWARNGGDVQFYIHGASNFDSLIRRTTMNRDCLYRPGWDDAAVAQSTEPDLDGDGDDATKKDKAVICDLQTAELERSAYGAQRADRIAVFSRGGNEKMVWDSDAGHWKVGKAYGGWSSPVGFHVVMPPSFGGSTLLAHELGHYLPAGHPFGYQPKTVAAARKLMETWASNNPGKDPAGVFDPDSRHGVPVLDTPPDASGQLWEAAFGDRCEESATALTIPVTVAGKTKNVVLAPNRRLVMSYFKGCAFDFHISRGQYARVHKALLTGNRKPLGEPDSSCYASGWDPGPTVDSEAKLADVLRRIARCKIKFSKQPPWQLDGKEIYVNPAAAARTKHIRRRGGVGVNTGRERRLIRRILRTPKRP